MTDVVKEEAAAAAPVAMEEEPPAKVEEVKKEEAASETPAAAAASETPAAAATIDTPAAAGGDTKTVEGDVTVDDRMFKQLEFYFSDSNLPKDKFLLKETKTNEGGWVSLQLISTFKKMREYGATVASLAAAARTSEFLAVDDAGEKVKRTTDLPDTDVTLERSISATGFPLETTLEEAEAFFAPIGKILSVRFNKLAGNKAENKPPTFTGTVFAEFATKEEAEEVGKKELEYKEVKLVLATKAAFLTALNAERKAADGGKDKKGGKDRKDKTDRPQRGDRKERGGKTPGEKRKRDDDGETVEGETVEGEDGEAVKKKKGRDGKPAVVEEKKEYVAYPKGVFVKLAGVGGTATMPNIKDHYTKYGNVKFVEYKEGETDACIRFETPEEAAEAVKGEEAAGTDFGGAVAVVTLLGGEEEDAKLEDIKQRQLTKIARGGGGG
ncbi:hypothetical protein T484DRAFT_1655578, partial [Baffinella frigidus]